MAFAKNSILSALSPGARAKLEDHLSPVELRAGAILYMMGEPVEHVYFVETGLLSYVTLVEDGGSVGVGIVGAEGAAGVTSALSDRPSYHQVSVYVRGQALRIDASRFAAAVGASPEIRRVIDRYVDALLISSELNTVCFALHPLEARISSSLVRAVDASGRDEVEVTQELLASMFAVHRTSVTSVAGAMERAGLIRSGRGAITIRDLAGLQRTACGCYSRQAKLWAEVWPAFSPAV